MTIHLEREIKLRPGPQFRGMELPGEELPTLRLRSVYYDTDDLRLARGSITLRRREGEGEPSWQLKLGRGTVRAEIGRPAPTAAVPEELAHLLIAHTRGRPLSPVATLATTRRGVRVQLNGHPAADVVEDQVDVLDEGRRVASFDEIEIESVDGDQRELEQLEKTLRDAGAVDPDGRPKLFQALDIEPERPGKRAHSTRAGVRSVLREQYRQILEHDPGTRLGADPESLHKQRVAVRRLRAQLRAGRPVLDRQWADELRDSLKGVGRALGVVRDLDVLIERIERQAANLDEPERSGATDVLDRLRSERRAAHAELVEHLSGPAYVSLLNRLEQAVEAPRFDGHGSVTKRLRKEHRRMTRMVKELPPSPTDRQLHAVRIAGKRVRYSAELASACGTGGLKRGIRRAKTFQDVLGDHQDAVVATRRLTELDTQLGRPAVRLALTALLERQDEDRSSARAAAPRAWRRLHRALPT